MSKEQVNHPEHYGGNVTHEVYKCLRSWGMENNALRWNAIKYLARANKKGLNYKDVLTDLEKAKWYLQCEIDKIKEAYEGKDA